MDLEQKLLQLGDAIRRDDDTFPDKLVLLVVEVFQVGNLGIERNTDR